MLKDNPPPGVAAYPVDGRIDKIMAQIQVSSATSSSIILAIKEAIATDCFYKCCRCQGPKGTVYEGGIFSISVDIPER